MADFNLFGWVINQLGVDKILKFGWNTAKWLKAGNAYASRIEEDYGKLFVLGKADPVPLESIYTAVNVLEKPSALRRYNPEQLHERFINRETLWLDRDKRQSGVDLVKTGKNIYILGKPGAGKSTFLKNVAIKAAQGDIGGKSPEMMPIFISLHAHANSGRTLIESIEHELSICRFPDVRLFVDFLLQSGRALILLDGLDEVKQEDEKRSKLIQDIKDFMRKYRESQFLMSCRVAATEYEFDNVVYLEMADFDNQQIHSFIKRWFRSTKQANECWKELSKKDNEGLFELARVPLLLTLLALTYEETQTFPNRRVEIYEEALDALLKRWDARRHIQRDEPYKTLSLGRKRQLFARIASQMFESKEFLIYESKLAEQIKNYMQKLPDAKDEIDGQAVLESIAAQHGIFVERANKIYSFAHLSFQEYYTAKSIVDSAASGTLRELIKHIAEDQWREVFLLTVSLLEEETANTFFDLLIKELNKIARNNEKVDTLLARTDAALKNSRLSEFFELGALRAHSLGITSGVGIEINNYSSSKPDYALHGENILDESLHLSLSFRLSLIVAAGELHKDSHNNHESYYFCEIGRDIISKLRGYRKFDQSLVEIEQKLKKLKIPVNQSKKHQDTEFANSIKIILDEFDEIIGAGSLEVIDESEIDHSSFRKYRKVGQLITTCLKLSIVSDRKNIIGQLFLSTKKS